MQRSGPPSALKAHCRPGPKSPTRCNSALNAAIPPTFVPYDSAVAFHKSLKPRELANPQFRTAVGELANALHKKNTVDGLRSIATLENLCGLSQNESAVSYLRELAKSFGRDESGTTRKSTVSSVSTSHGVSTSSNLSSGNVPLLSSKSRNVPTDSSALSEGTSQNAEDESVRFSASVQSKLFDSTESPSTISEHSSKQELSGRSPSARGRTGGGDNIAGGSSGGSSTKKSRVSKRSFARGSTNNSKHFSNRDGDVSPVPMETSGSKKSLLGSAVPPMVQLQSNTKNVDKVRRKSKKGAGTPKRVTGK